MRFRYGSYQHALYEVSPESIVRRMERSENGLPQRMVTTMTLTGDKQASSVSALTTALVQLERAYSIDGRDAIWADSTGRELVHSIRSAQTISGVKVVEPVSYPVGRGVEYAIRRTFRIVLEWETLPASGSGGTGQQSVTAFSETITFQGDGGPLKTILQPLRGKPIEQIVAEQTPFFATQSGSTRQQGASPQPPAPLWPDKLQGSASSVNRSGRDPQTGEYQTDWNYNFLSATRLIGSPNSL
jgi:hypothetical protein